MFEADCDEGKNMPLDLLDFKLKIFLPGFTYGKTEFRFDYYQTSHLRQIKFQGNVDNLPEFDVLYDIDTDYREFHWSQIVTLREENKDGGSSKGLYASFPGFEIHFK